MAARNQRFSSKGRVWENGKELSEDLKRLIVAELIEKGADSVTGHIPDNISLREIAGKFRVHHTTVNNTWRKFVLTRSFEAKKRGQGNTRKLNEGEIQLIEHLKLAKPSISHQEIVGELNQHGNLPYGTSITAISRVVRNELNMTYKKLVKVKGDKFTPQNIIYCQNFLNYMTLVPANKVKFYDESGFDLSMCNPNYGHAYEGNRACEIVNERKGTTWTLMLLCSLEGIDYAKLVGETVETIEYLRFWGEAVRFTTPFGRQMFSAGDHIVLDNASIHRYEAGDVLVDWLAQQQAWMIFTPTYSPEFNAAEFVFNYMKTILKQSHVRQVARQNLPAAIFGIIRTITPRMMYGFYRKLKYLPV